MPTLALFGTVRDAPRQRVAEEEELAFNECPLTPVPTAGFIG